MAIDNAKVTLGSKEFSGRWVPLHHTRSLLGLFYHRVLDAAHKSDLWLNRASDDKEAGASPNAIWMVSVNR
jgi:hypothetical protein